MKIFLPIILLFSLVSPAKAQMNCGKLADYYLEYVKPDGDTTINWYRYGYYQGFVSGWDTGYRGPFINIPSVVTNGQVARVVGRWLRAHPEHWHRSRDWCVGTALSEAWPKK